jgi:glucose-1-phosphate thymidylyltransferase
MIYYPLSILLASNIKEILIITKKEDIDLYKNLLGDGSKLGIYISYKIQNKPNGIGEAFILGEEFIGEEPVCLALGDNIFSQLHNFEDYYIVTKYCCTLTYIFFTTN